MKYIIQEQTMKNFADFIRNKTGVTQALTPDAMIEVGNTIIEAAQIIDSSFTELEDIKTTHARNYAFYKDNVKTSISFPNATQIGDYAFYKCANLTSVNIPQTTSIGSFAFRGCSSLTEANFPLTSSIGQNVFDECTSLTSVNMPLITTIDTLMFRYCEALTSAMFPNATQIRTRAFYGSGITSLTLPGSTVCVLESTDAFTFTPIANGTGYIYVPSNLLESYKTSVNWSEYADQIATIA